jgi:hypothetical protein
VTEGWDLFMIKYVEKYREYWAQYRSVRERAKGIYASVYERLICISGKKTQKLTRFPDIHPNLKFPVLPNPRRFATANPFFLEKFYIDQIRDAFDQQNSAPKAPDDKRDFLPSSLLGSTKGVASQKRRGSPPKLAEREYIKAPESPTEETVDPLFQEDAKTPLLMDQLSEKMAKVSIHEKSPESPQPIAILDEDECQSLEIVFDDTSSIPWRHLTKGQQAIPDRYADRVRRWSTRNPFTSDPEYRDKELSPGAKMEIRFRHDFAHVLDQLLVEFGTVHIRTDDPDRIERVSYTLPGETIFADGTYFKGVFELTRGRNKKIFHRYFAEKAPSTIEREFATNGYFVGSVEGIPPFAIEPGVGECLGDDGSFISDFDEWSIEINNTRAHTAMLRVFPLPKL